MKYLMCYLIIFLFVFAIALSEEEYNFRMTRWGMSIKEVIKSEPAMLSSEADNHLIYKSLLGDYFCNIVYYFEQDKLVRAWYTIKLDMTYGLNKREKAINSFFSKYRDFKTILIEKYGYPVRQYWYDYYLDKLIIDKTNKDLSSEDFIRILFEQDSQYCMEWETKRTRIRLSMKKMLIESFIYHIEYEDIQIFEDIETREKMKVQELYESF